MRCENCGNNATTYTQPTEPDEHLRANLTLSKPFTNLGRKIWYPTLVTRYMLCNHCGHQFLSYERYFRPVSNTSSQASLFEHKQDD